MTATVRLDEKLEKRLDALTASLHKKKSEVIREAIEFYAQNVENTKQSKILQAVEKTKDIDKQEFKDFDEVADDGLQG